LDRCWEFNIVEGSAATHHLNPEINHRFPRCAKTCVQYSISISPDRQQPTKVANDLKFGALDQYLIECHQSQQDVNAMRTFDVPLSFACKEINVSYNYRLLSNGYSFI
jgi:hypothetical protein